MDRHRIDTEFGSISYLQKKASERSIGTIIFLHGLGGTGNAWIRVTNLLRDDLDIYMPDLLGHGRSDKSRGSYTVTDQVGAMRSLVHDLGIESPAMAGNSYGGWVSLRYALRDSLSFLILVDSAGINPTVAEISPLSVEKFVEDAVRMSPFNDPNIIRAMLLENSKPAEKLTQEDLSRIRTKTMIIWGSEDDVIPLKYGEMLHKFIVGSTMFILEGEGHTPHIGSPLDVAQLINGLFNHV